MGYSNIIILCIVGIVLFFKCYIVLLMRLSLNGLLKHHKALYC